MREVRYLDPYTAGEKPKINVQFYQQEVDLTGFTVDLRVNRDGEPLELLGGIDWLDQTKGQARITMDEGDIDVSDDASWSRYEIEAWAGNGVDRVATLLIVFDVYPHVGADVPAI
jgi:hypothetical protein